MGVKFWHLLVVGALAVSAVAAVVHIGRGATNDAKRAAAANVRSAIPSLEAFYADHGTYGGADISALRRDYDPGIDPSVKLGWVETGRYCLESTVEGQTASATGSNGEVVFGGC